MIKYNLTHVSTYGLIDMLAWELFRYKPIINIWSVANIPDDVWDRAYAEAGSDDEWHLQQATYVMLLLEEAENAP